jgi:tetratricopeptide (TPR) repeat protein
MQYQANRPVLLLLAFLILATLTYWPGLVGGFVYDDWSSISGNPNVQIVQGRWAEWWHAALSFPSGTPPFRSLTMLSFAANHYFTGLDPYAYKLTNLIIHLVNGLLLFLTMRAMFELRQSVCGSGSRPFNGPLAAAALAGLWLLLPINLTAVLYVVQRLESFATTFVFLGLWLYFRARLSNSSYRGGGIGMSLAIMLCTGVGITAKEPAAMLPLYAALADGCLTGFRNRDGRLSKSALILFAATLLLPMMVGGVWIWSRYFNLEKIVAPENAVITRLMTEARIMFEYMHWSLLPSLDSLTLYHDDIARSGGLLDPPTTLVSILGILGLLAAAVWQRKRHPLFSIGILWFFAGHLLTGTVIPLILAFEHRNYFSSSGLLLAAASLITLESGIRQRQAIIAVVSMTILFWGGTTWMRAQEWSDPLRLAQSDAIKRPQSSAAQYDFAQALLLKSIETQKSEPANAALRVLDQARRLPGAGIHFEQSMITLLAESGYRAPGEVWESLISKLKARGPDTNEVHALVRLNHCFSNKECKPEDLPMLAKGYEVALSHPNTPSSLLAVHGEYAWHVINDRKLAERDYREVLRRSPKEIEAASNLIVVLIHQGKFEEAEALIMDLESRNHLSALDGFLKPLHSTLESVRKRQETHDD